MSSLPVPPRRCPRRPARSVVVAAFAEDRVVASTTADDVRRRPSTGVITMLFDVFAGLSRKPARRAGGDQGKVDLGLAFKLGQRTRVLI